MRRYGTIEKNVGETPLQAIERFRHEQHIPVSVPLAYAGRLDPMASGTLLVLIGDECKRQEQYHGLDKEYVVEILFGISSDTGDVLGITKKYAPPIIHKDGLKTALASFIGQLALSYPHFSSKTVRGKPLHVWTLEGRLSEIEIPVRRSRIYRLELADVHMIPLQEIVKYAQEKIETVSTVTEESKALGRDFRRTDVRAGWKVIGSEHEDTLYCVATITCTASSGTYMRSLAEELGKQIGTCALAYSIHRTKIGKYFPVTKNFGVWYKKFY